MKNKTITLIMMIFLAFIMWLSFQYDIFYKRLYNLESHVALNSMSYVSFYIEDNNSMPLSNDQIISWYNNTYDEDYIGMVYKHLHKDYLSNQERLITYYPLYDREGKKPVSYILLSTGIDGRINNVFSEKDTLFFDDWKARVKLYNPEIFEYDSTKYDFVNFENLKERFSLWDRLFGDKDLLIMIAKLDNKTFNLTSGDLI